MQSVDAASRTAGPSLQRTRRFVDLQDYLQIVRKRWRVIALVTLLAVGVAAASTALLTRTYESSTQFFVSTTGADDSGALLQGSTFTQQRVKSYAQLLTSPSILSPVAEQSRVPVEELQRGVRATSLPDTVLIDVAVRSADPQQARDIAAAIADIFPETVTDLESPTSGAPSPVKVTVVKEPTLPTLPVSPQPVRNILLGLVIGAVLGLATALVRDTLDRRVKSVDDLKRVTDAPILGVVAFDAGTPERPLIVEVDPRSPRSESFRSLRTNLTFVDAAEHLQSIVVTSSLPGEGKSTVTANLALSLAQAGGRVCLVEADLRRPKVLSYMGLDGSVGLTDALVGRADVVDVFQQYGEMDLWVLGAGPIPPNPSELLGSARMSKLLDDLRGRFDHVLLDAPPVLPVTDAVVLATQVDGVIVVAGSGIIEHDQLSSVMDSLESVNASVLGLVLNRVPAKAGGAYTRYEYQLPEEDVTRKEKRRVRSLS
jgi:capsular exopolysaccharide synthesis family protein